MTVGAWSVLAAGSTIMQHEVHAPLDEDLDRRVWALEHELKRSESA